MLELNLEDGRRRLLTDAEVLAVAQYVLRSSTLYYIPASELARSVHRSLIATYGPLPLHPSLVISALSRMGVAPERYHPSSPRMFDVRRLQRAKGAGRVA
jgi:hypothetical protein